MLVVGEAGLGKTTFVRNLFAAYARDPSFPVLDARGAGPETQKVLARVCLWGCGVGGPRETRVWGGTRPALPSPQPYRAPTDSRPHPPSFDTHVHPHTQTHTRDQVFAEHPERLCTEIVLQDADSKIWWHYLVQASCWEESWRGGGGGGRLPACGCALTRRLEHARCNPPPPTLPRTHAQDTPGYGDSETLGADREGALRACVLGRGGGGARHTRAGRCIGAPPQSPAPLLCFPPCTLHTHKHTHTRPVVLDYIRQCSRRYLEQEQVGGRVFVWVCARACACARALLPAGGAGQQKTWVAGGGAGSLAGGRGGGGGALLALPPPHTHTLTRPPRPSLNAHTGPRAPAGHARHPGHARGRVPLLSGAPPPAPGTRACACVPLLSRAPAPAPGVRLPLLPPNQPHAHPLTPHPHTHRWTWCSCGSWRGRSP